MEYRFTSLIDESQEGLIFLYGLTFNKLSPKNHLVQNVLMFSDESFGNNINLSGTQRLLLSQIYIKPEKKLQHWRLNELC